MLPPDGEPIWPAHQGDPPWLVRLLAALQRLTNLQGKAQEAAIPFPLQCDDHLHREIRALLAVVRRLANGLGTRGGITSRTMPLHVALPPLVGWQEGQRRAWQSHTAAHALSAQRWLCCAQQSDAATPQGIRARRLAYWAFQQRAHEEAAARRELEVLCSAFEGRNDPCLAFDAERSANLMHGRGLELAGEIHTSTITAPTDRLLLRQHHLSHLQLTLWDATWQEGDRLLRLSRSAAESISESWYPITKGWTHASRVPSLLAICAATRDCFHSWVMTMRRLDMNLTEQVSAPYLPQDDT